MAKAHDLTGKRYGKLTVVSRAENSKHGATRWRCHCDCGGIKVIVSQNLVEKKTISCGCVGNGSRVNATRHLLSRMTKENIDIYFDRISERKEDADGD